MGAITAVADYLARQHCSDYLSPMSLVLRGEDSSPSLADEDSPEGEGSDTLDASQSHPFGIDASLFLQLSEHFELTVPELSVARSGVYNYFSSQRIDKQQFIFHWEGGDWSMDVESKADADFVIRLSASMYFKVDDKMVPDMIAGKRPWLMDTFPALRALRDIVSRSV
jgi:hypothetical protein